MGVIPCQFNFEGIEFFIFTLFKSTIGLSDKKKPKLQKKKNRNFFFN